MLKGILTMIILSSCQKISTMRFVFQPLPYASRRSLIMVVAFKTVGGDWRAKELGVGSHLSPQIFIFFPLPTFHLKPTFRTDFEARILFQIKE